MNVAIVLDVNESPNTRQNQIWDRRVSDWRNTYANLAKGIYEVVQIDWDRVGLKRIESRPIMGNGVITYLSSDRFNVLPKEWEKPKGVLRSMRDRFLARLW